MNYATHKWEVYGDTFISFTTGGPVTDAVWDDFVKDLRTKAYSTYLGTSVGIVELSSVQRKNAAEGLKSRNAKSAVVTDERLVRGLVTAVSWLGVNVKAFSWAELRESISFLKLSPDSIEAVYDRVVLMRNRF